MAVKEAYDELAELMKDDDEGGGIFGGILDTFADAGETAMDAATNASATLKDATISAAIAQIPFAEIFVKAESGKLRPTMVGLIAACGLAFVVYRGVSK